MSTARWHQLADALLELEMAMREAGLWSALAPSAEQLASSAPFCIDTLDFEQWLQWLFIPRMAAIIAAGQPMPGRFDITPMGEEAFAHLGRRKDALIVSLARIDRLAATMA
jgi:uncharacterized protein YqcC (DUF446 family)